jgi:hypothetical protein
MSLPKWASGAVLLVALTLVATRSAEGAAEDFKFKWPYDPAASASITTFPYTSVHDCSHECTDAWDIVISNGKYHLFC